MKYPGLLNHDVARVGIEESRKLNLIVGGMITDVIKKSLGPRGMGKGTATDFLLAQERALGRS